MSTTVLVLEGPDGCGKSTHADTLAAALRERGVDAVAFHHAKPADADPVLAALDYAAQRRRLMLAPPARVVVADRWWLSSRCLGNAMVESNETAGGHVLRQVGCGLSSLSNAESWWLPILRVAILDAPDAVLDARLAERGTPATPFDHALRRDYRAAWTHRDARVDTSRPREAVAAGLLAWAMGVLS